MALSKTEKADGFELLIIAEGKDMNELLKRIPKLYKKLHNHNHPDNKISFVSIGVFSYEWKEILKNIFNTKAYILYGRLEIGVGFE